ncbi:MAG: ribosome biogenesis factor YjgA [Pseudohongiellaceae bacterium]
MKTTIEPESDSELPSKSHLKRQATELQDLGKRLTTYSTAKLRKLPVTETLIAAIEEFNRLPNSHGAQRRQLQFIGRLMRDIDYDAVVDAIEGLETVHLKKQKKPSATKLLGASILESGDSQINAALEQHPTLERQTLRQLYREYHRADEAGRDKYKIKLQNYLQKQIPT